MERDMAFFRNGYQVEGMFGEEPAKVPVYYYDGTTITGIFLAKASVLKKFLPKRSYYLSPVFPGIAAVAVTCFEYRDTDIRPYNELSISIPMTYRKPSLIPGAALLSGLKNNQFDVYVHHLPVTTQVALDGGVVVYNYPKFMSTIEFEDRGAEVDVTLKEDGELILRATTKKIPANESKTYRYVTYPVKDDCAQTADVLVNAKKFGQSISWGGMRLELGDKHPIAKELESALISRNSFMHQYAPEFQSILYGPNRLE